MSADRSTSGLMMLYVRATTKGATEADKLAFDRAIAEDCYTPSGYMVAELLEAAKLAYESALTK